MAGKLPVLNRPGFITLHKNVAAAGTAEVGPTQAIANGVKLLIKAKKANTNDVFIGASKDDAEDVAARYILPPNEALTLCVDNMNKIWLDATTNGEGVELIAEI